MPLLPGEVIAKTYRVLQLLGEGGMGAVYACEHLRLGKPVAIKVMHPSIAFESDLVARFEREAIAAARVASRHVVDVLDFGVLPHERVTHGSVPRHGQRYMVMELLRGESLSRRLSSRERLASHELAVIALQLLEGLSKVHDAGILHRDLKPANVFLEATEDGLDFVKLLDFGICKFLERTNGDETTTAVGHVLGTPAYMAPELLADGPRETDPRCDVYSVGVILYRCVAGRLPYASRDIVDLLMQMHRSRPPRLRDIVPGVDPKLATIIETATAPKPNSRFRDARDFRYALADWARGIDRVDRLLAEFLEVDKDVQRRPFEAITRPYPVLDDEDALLDDASAAEDTFPGPRDSHVDFGFEAEEPATTPR